MQANLAALQLLSSLQHEDRAASADEQQVLARWSSWGAVPDIFDEAREKWAAERAQLRTLLDDRAYAAARRTTINAHYTDPAYVQAIWTALGDLGFDGGLVLEPGVGAGTFIGMAPASADMVGVELDPTTAAIAGALYPQATIRTESFADTPYRAAHFDATVGNVPFADVRLHDPRHNRGGHALHNHCIIKSLALTRPGGIVAVLTSRYTLDAQNPAARREMNAMADLVGAVRLPTGAHQRAAGTQVVTDLLILRRREPDQAPASMTWEHSHALGLDDSGDLRVNAYFDKHPDHVLGTYAISTGQYGTPALQVRAVSDAGVDEHLARVLNAITTSAHHAGLTMTPSPAGQPSERVAIAPATGLWDGHLTVQADGSFTRVLNSEHTPANVPASQRVELRALLGVATATVSKATLSISRG